MVLVGGVRHVVIPVELADLEMIGRKVLHTPDQVSVEPEVEDLMRRNVGAGQVLVFGHFETPDLGKIFLIKCVNVPSALNQISIVIGRRLGQAECYV